MVPFLTKEKIREYAAETLREYQQVSGKEIQFPIDPIDIFERLFGLTVIYDDKGKLNELGKGIIGCMFPDGYPSPWVEDKVIAVNITKPDEPYCKKIGPGRLIVSDGSNDPTGRSENFTIAHEGMHYILHFQKGIMGAQYRRPIYCRTKNRQDPVEFQANAGAGELLMPLDKVEWLLDGKKPPTIIDLDLYERQLRQFFDASRGMIERRLTYLGYKVLNALYDWADYTVEQKKQAQETNKRIDAIEKVKRAQEKLDSFTQSLFDFDVIGSSSFNFESELSWAKILGDIFPE